MSNEGYINSTLCSHHQGVAFFQEPLCKGYSRPTNFLFYVYRSQTELLTDRSVVLIIEDNKGVSTAGCLGDDVNHVVRP